MTIARAHATSCVKIERRGPIWRLSSEQWVPHPTNDVFPFFGAARNLERLTPPFLRFQILVAPPEPLRTGALIDYRLHLHGIPVGWRTRIEEWEPPERFVDIQLRGPFRSWRHLHEFHAVGSGTLMRDTVDFDVFCRPLAHTPILGWIRRDLGRIFEYRRQQIANVFGTSNPATRQAGSTCGEMSGARRASPPTGYEPD